MWSCLAITSTTKQHQASLKISFSLLNECSVMLVSTHFIQYTAFAGCKFLKAFATLLHVIVILNCIAVAQPYETTVFDYYNCC